MANVLPTVPPLPDPPSPAPSPSRLSRICLIIAGLVFVAILVDRVGSYLDGQTFDKSWSWRLLPVGVVGLFLLLAGGIVALISAFLTLIEWRRPSRSRLVAIFAVPLAFVVARALPLPSFTDGMSVALREKTTPERLRQFAEAARDLPLDPAKTTPSWEPPDDWARLMQRDFPDLHELFPLPTRISAGRDSTTIFWGSALVKHWGIRIELTPAAAADRDQLQSEVWTASREVHPGIWVYHERY